MFQTLHEISKKKKRVTETQLMLAQAEYKIMGKTGMAFVLGFTKTGFERCSYEFPSYLSSLLLYSLLNFFLQTSLMKLNRSCRLMALKLLLKWLKIEKLSFICICHNFSHVWCSSFLCIDLNFHLVSYFCPKNFFSIP